jgi:hypothetical protein
MSDIFPSLPNYPHRIVVQKHIADCKDVFLWLLERYGYGAGRSKQYLSIEAKAKKIADIEDAWTVKSMKSGNTKFYFKDADASFLFKMVWG